MAAFADMLNGIPFLNDSDLRAKPYDRVLPLLNNPMTPPETASAWKLAGEDEREIRRAVKMADEFHMNLILGGGVEAYKAAPLLAEKHIPILLSLNFGQEPGVAATNFGGGAGGAGGAGGGNRPGGGGGGGAG